MSKVAIQGNASGTGTFTIAAPNSNTDRTLTLPDEAGTVLTSASSIPVANLDSAVGITEADVYILNTNVTSTDNTVTDITAWSRPSFDGFAQLGTGVSVSSGIFTFPSTGLWKIDFTGRYINNNNTNSRFCRIFTYCTTDNSTYTIRGFAGQNMTNAATGQDDINLSVDILFNVTNTSTHKIKTAFVVHSSAADTSLAGDSTQYGTNIIFVRLGDAQ